MLKIYALKNFPEFRIQLNPICIKPNSLGKYRKYVVYHKTSGEYKKVYANDLEEVNDSTSLTLTYTNEGMWKGTGTGGVTTTQPLNQWITKIKDKYHDLSIVLNVGVDDRPSLSDFSININNMSKISIIYNSETYISDSDDKIESSVINISGVTTEISGLRLLYKYPQQLFNIINSNVTLTDIDISGKHLDLNERADSPLISYKEHADAPLISYKEVSSDPIFYSTPPSNESPNPSSLSNKLILRDICINTISYNRFGIIEINGAKNVDISNLTIQNCTGKMLSEGSEKSYLPSVPDAPGGYDRINTLWSPLTLLNTSATILNSKFLNNNQFATPTSVFRSPSHSAQAITLYNSSMNIIKTDFSMSTQVSNYFNTIFNRENLQTDLSSIPRFWEEKDMVEYDLYRGSIPMIRNYGISGEKSYEIKIEGCSWNTGKDLSNANYIYFFVDKQDIDHNGRYSYNNITISNSNRSPKFTGRNTRFIYNIPSFNIYSMRSMYYANISNSDSLFKDVYNFVGPWYDDLPSSSENKNLYVFTSNNEHYALNRNFGIEKTLYLYKKDSGWKLEPYLTGIVCVSNNTSELSANRCGSLLENQWTSNWAIYNSNLNNNNICANSCACLGTDKIDCSNRMVPLVSGERWICDLTQMETLIRKLPGPLYSTNTEQIPISDKINANVFDSRIIYKARSSDSGITQQMMKAGYDTSIAAVKDFNDTGCNSYYKNFFCPNIDSDTVCEWNSDLSWNKLFTTPAAYCNVNSVTDKRCALGSYKEKTTQANGIQKASWVNTYNGSDTKQSGNAGFLTIDYCNANIVWSSTDLATGKLQFKELDNTTADCSTSGNPTGSGNWSCKASGWQPPNEDKNGKPRKAQSCQAVQPTDCSSYYQWDNTVIKNGYTYGCIWTPSGNNEGQCKSAWDAGFRGTEVEQYRCWPKLDDYKNSTWGYGVQY